jgi:hypothetical protein
MAVCAPIGVLATFRISASADASFPASSRMPRAELDSFHVGFRYRDQ